MLGHSHAVSASAAWSAVVCAAPAVGIHPHWGAIAAGLLSTAGAGLLPDADHPDAMIAHSFGLISQVATKFINRVSGGHRHATHSLLFCLAAPLATWLGDALLGRRLEIAMLFVLYALGIRALRLAPGMAVLAGFGAACATWFLLPDLNWLPWSVAAGVLAHVAGDCLTREGCPLLWPHRRHYMLPIIRRTGNRLEVAVIAPLCAVAAVALLVLVR